MSSKPFALSVKIMISNKQGLYLLLRRSPSCKSNAGKWEMPGGKIEPCESFENALLREVKEETGLDIEMTGVAGTAQSETPCKKIAYLIMEGISELQSVTLSNEHDAYEWVEKKKLIEKDLAKQFIPFVKQFVTSKEQ